MLYLILDLIVNKFNPIIFFPPKFKDQLETILAARMCLDKLDSKVEIFKKVATFDSYLLYLLTCLADRKEENALSVHVVSSGFTDERQMDLCGKFEKIHHRMSSRFSKSFVLSSLERIRYLMFRDLANFISLSFEQRLELCSMIASISVNVNKLKDIIDEFKTPLQNTEKILVCKDIILLKDESFSEKFASFVSRVKSTDMSENDVVFYTIMCAQYNEIFFHIAVLLELQSEY